MILGAKKMKHILLSITLALVACNASSTNTMSEQKQIVENYMEGFRHTDHKKILACLTDDVVWKCTASSTTKALKLTTKK